MKDLPSYQKMMLPTVLALQKLNGTASHNQISFMVMCELDLPKQYVEKAFKQLGFSRTYLKKFGIIDNDKRGIWTLNSKYLNMEADELEKIIKDRYKELYNL